VWSTAATWPREPHPPLAAVRCGRMKELDEKLLAFWHVCFRQCSFFAGALRGLHCPQGIDTSLITQAARQVLAELGLGLVPEQAGLALGSPLPHRQPPLSCPLPPERLVARPGVDAQGTQTDRTCAVLSVDEQGGAGRCYFCEAEEYRAKRPQAFMACTKIFHAAGWPRAVGLAGVVMAVPGCARPAAGGPVRAERALTMRLLFSIGAAPSRF
jgi:hypothetical protein